MHQGKVVNLDNMLFYGKSQLGKVMFTDGQFAQCLSLNGTPVHPHLLPPKERSKKKKKKKKKTSYICIPL